MHGPVFGSPHPDPTGTPRSLHPIKFWGGPKQRLGRGHQRPPFPGLPVLASKASLSLGSLGGSRGDPVPKSEVIPDPKACGKKGVNTAGSILI